MFSDLNPHDISYLITSSNKKKNRNILLNKYPKSSELHQHEAMPAESFYA